MRLCTKRCRWSIAVSCLLIVLICLPYGVVRILTPPHLTVLRHCSDQRRRIQQNLEIHMKLAVFALLALLVLSNPGTKALSQTTTPESTAAITPAPANPDESDRAAFAIEMQTKGLNNGVEITVVSHGRKRTNLTVYMYTSRSIPFQLGDQSILSPLCRDE
jgi:hypothetical protein